MIISRVIFPSPAFSEHTKIIYIKLSINISSKIMKNIFRCLLLATFFVQCMLEARTKLSRSRGRLSSLAALRLRRVQRLRVGVLACSPLFALLHRLLFVLCSGFVFTFLFSFHSPLSMPLSSRNIGWLEVPMRCAL